MRTRIIDVLNESTATQNQSKRDQRGHFYNMMYSFNLLQYTDEFSRIPSTIGTESAWR